MKKKRYYDTLWNTMKSNIFCHKLENAAQILNPWYAMDTCTGYPENGKISFLLHSCTIVLVKPFRSRWTHGVPWYTYRFLVLEFGRSHIVTMCLQFTQLAYTLFSPPPHPTPHTHTHCHYPHPLPVDATHPTPSPLPFLHHGDLCRPDLVPLSSPLDRPSENAN